MVMRKLLYRLGLAPLSELHELRCLNAVLFGRARALEAENETLAGWVAWHQNEAEALRAENRLLRIDRNSLRDSVKYHSLEADALRAENANLKRAAAERLRDEIPPLPSLFIDPYHATDDEAERIRNTPYRVEPRPFGREWVGPVSDLSAPTGSRPPADISDRETV